MFFEEKTKFKELWLTRCFLHLSLNLCLYHSSFCILPLTQLHLEILLETHQYWIQHFHTEHHYSEHTKDSRKAHVLGAPKRARDSPSLWRVPQLCCPQDISGHVHCTVGTPCHLQPYMWYTRWEHPQGTRGTRQEHPNSMGHVGCQRNIQTA